MEIKVLMERFAAWLLLQGYAPKTIKNMKDHIKLFVTYLDSMGTHEVEGLSADLLKDYQEHLALKSNKQGLFLQATYRNKILSSIRSFLKWLHQQDLVMSDLGKELLHIKEAKKLPRNIPTQEEMCRLLEMPNIKTHGGYRDRLMMELLYATGLRSHELLNLKISDVDLERAYLHVREGKGAKDRVLPLGPGICELIRHYLFFVRGHFMNGKVHDYLFPSRKAKALGKNQLARQIKDYVKKAGMTKKVSTHTLRHACATHMMQNGAPIRYVQELLGHANINSTQIYTHVTITDLKKAHAKYHPRERKEKRPTHP